MNFFDIEPAALPQRSQYFFNIVVRIISVNPEVTRQALGIEGVDSICDIEHIMDSRPYILYIDTDEEKEFGEYSYEEYSHCVVEVSPFEVSWYNMLDSDVNTRWRIDTQWEIEYTPEEEDL